MLHRAPLLLALAACGPAVPDETSGSTTDDGATTSSTSTTATSSTATSSTATTDPPTTGLVTTDVVTTDVATTDVATTDATATTTNPGSSTGASTGAVDPVICEAAALIELKDPIAAPPNWGPGETVTIGVTLVNTGPMDFNWYPGIRVTADLPGVTSGMPENFLFAIFAGMENSLEVVFEAAPDAPTPSVVTFTIEVIALNDPCPGLAQVQLQVPLN